ncbi:beta-3-deoxy-D-manno-oct-2-ulosonic acid transferase [Aquirhabdus parva]|uniref:Beta-3-deoxy-D-manno-oct-2-ulosonic acid transferase n=2 Tax=Aquirhabdus parva TaxID=2283318 RepID=A0A345P3W8_9GAMM|nr:beta-3-deoxy-D-manno-oct-2-ulosonic acid transferase [Aquirhabdus parva]
MCHDSDEILYAFGFSPWKRPLVRRFLNQHVAFVYWSWQVPSDATLVLWGNRPIPDGISSSVKIIRLEDGFLRSVGLGADLTKPLSWVIDRTGIYYDPTQPSDIENILNTTVFDGRLISRARHLSEKLITAGLTKYNVSGKLWQKPNTARQIILVVGQVESDASIQFGANDIRSNLSLLTTVRQANPDAFIIYKPHPDVVAGLRTQGRLNAGELCNEVVVDVSMDHLLAQVDEVHVITSLAGFEALLRGKVVFCYGQPFYAGWGLTIDRQSHPRRIRQLTLDELIAGTLILYPTYVSRKTHQQISVEEALEELIYWRNEQKTIPPFVRRLLRFLLRRK